MTIDEIIEHAEKRVRGNDQYVKEHAQLADLLRGLKLARTEIDLLKTLRDGFKADAQKYKTENEKLRKLVLRNWYIALSEREALRVYGIDPDGGAYIAALNDEIVIAKDHMHELGIEVN